MLSAECLRELRTSWLPNLTDGALDRLADLLESGSPYLVHGCFSKSVPMGCLATHAAWHHPRTEHLNMEAGISWLHHIAGLNPATSLVLREWDSRGSQDWDIRTELASQFRAEQERRGQAAAAAEQYESLVEA